MTRILTILKIRKIFKQHQVQLTTDAINLMDEHISRQIESMAKNCKNSNVKRLTADLFWVALGRLNQKQ